MSFASKIKTWGLATFATCATDQQKTTHESTQIDVLPLGERENTIPLHELPERLKVTESPPCVAQVASVARGPTFKNEVVEVHNPKLRHRLEVNGLSPDDALALAVKLHARKTDFDDRRVCHECAHFARGLCSNARKAELSIRMPLMRVPEFMDQQLQRCPGFSVSDF